MEGGIALGAMPEASGRSGRSERPNAVSPLTPPHGSNEARDYLGAAEPGATSPTPSQRRKSNFAEGLDEVRK